MTLPRLLSALFVALLLSGCTGSSGRTMQPRVAPARGELDRAETSCAGDVCFVYADE